MIERTEKGKADVPIEGQGTFLVSFRLHQASSEGDVVKFSSSNHDIGTWNIQACVVDHAIATKY